VLTVAAVRGIASGGGAELAMSLDVSFASEKVIFRHPEVGIGKCQLKSTRILRLLICDID
jgi:enoyl-CoA hydratase/carnithine racemase